MVVPSVCDCVSKWMNVTSSCNNTLSGQWTRKMLHKCKNIYQNTPKQGKMIIEVDAAILFVFFTSMLASADDWIKD